MSRQLTASIDAQRRVLAQLNVTVDEHRLTKASNTELAAACRYSVRWVEAAIRALRDAGTIQVRFEPGTGKRIIKVV